MDTSTTDQTKSPVTNSELSGARLGVAHEYFGSVDGFADSLSISVFAARCDKPDPMCFETSRISIQVGISGGALILFGLNPAAARELSASLAAAANFIECVPDRGVEV